MSRFQTLERLAYYDDHDDDDKLHKEELTVNQKTSKINYNAQGK